MNKYFTHSAEETEKLAEIFLKELQGGEVVELIGNLGAGKTTFVRGLLRAMGSKIKVKSPTFTLLNEYSVNFKEIKKVVHLDFYRLQDPSQLESLAMPDYQRDDTIIFIEWPDIFGTSMITSSHKIEFEFIDEETREIIF